MLLINKLNIMQKIEIKKNLQNSIIPYFFEIPIFNFMNLKYIKIHVEFKQKQTNIQICLDLK